ncbi:MAG: Rrf2 family transcriptional regulator [Flavobacteriaceae bacterium]
MLSNSSKYALKAVLFLAVHSDSKKKILVKDFSKLINVPKAYLSKLLQKLARHNIVSSMRGPRGGFYLNNENRAVHLIEIINVIDGEKRLTSCMLSLNKCKEEHPCPLHDLLGDTKTHFLKKIEETTVEDLVSDIREGKSFLPL